MVEMMIYAGIALALVLFWKLGSVNAPKRHRWYEVDSAHLSMVSRRKKRSRR